MRTWTRLRKRRTLTVDAGEHVLMSQNRMFSNAVSDKVVIISPQRMTVKVRKAEKNAENSLSYNLSICHGPDMCRRYGQGRYLIYLLPFGLADAALNRGHVISVITYGCLV